jgi:hypothetical protein
VRAAATFLFQAWVMVCVWGGGSPVYLRLWRKHQWKWRTPAILPGRLARRGRQHKGVVVAKMVARVEARFGWGKLLRMAPYIGKLVPTTRNRRRLQSYSISILIRSGFRRRSQGTEGFLSRRQCKLGLALVLREDDEVLAWPACAARWPPGREVGHMKDKKRGREKMRLAGPDSISGWVSARYRIRIRKLLFFFKSLYNLQTNLNSIKI